MKRILGKAAPMTGLVALCLALAACGGEDEPAFTVVNTGTEVALVPALPGLRAPDAQMTNGSTGPQRVMFQQEAAQDISPDPIPARDPSATGTVNSGTGSESGSGSTSSDTQGTGKR